MRPVDRLEPMSSIVLIEEDDLMRGLLMEWLTAAGYAVRERGLREAPAGESADLVIVDLYMPRQAGADVVRAAQQAHPGTPVIAISAQFRPGLAGSWWAARSLGARKLIAKPFTREDLLEAVRAVIGPAP
jgi:DNA-binding response OmpR family regulator